MAVLGLSIAGRLEEGEMLKAWVSGSATALHWQALVNGQWINVGTANSDSYVIPAGAAGTSYRLAGTSAAGTVFSTATGAAIADSKKANAPHLDGPEFSLLTGEQAVGDFPVFASVAFSDSDKGNFAGGSLLVEDSMSTAHGGDGNDRLWIQFNGTAAGQFSYNAITREVSYAFTNNRPTVIGTLDAAMSGDTYGRDLKIVFNSNATAAVVDRLIDNLQFTNNDDSPTADRLLTLRVTDPTGASAQRVTSVHVESAPDAPMFVGSWWVNVDENEPVALTALAIDLDRETDLSLGMTYGLVSGLGDDDNALFVIDSATGVLRFLTVPDFEDPLPALHYAVRVRATDTQGSSSDEMFVINVRDANEAPVARPVAGTVLENGAPAPIALDVSDPDAGDTLRFTFNPAGVVGTVTFDGASLTYDPAGRFEWLAAGQTFTNIFGYTVTDAAGLSSTSAVTVTVVGQNDAATITGDASGTLADEPGLQNSALTVSGQMTVTDPDQGESRAFASGPFLPGHGFVSVDANGRWTYTASNSQVQSVGEGESLVERFTISSLDRTATKEVLITLQGSNDTPAFNSFQPIRTAVEAGAASPGTPSITGRVWAVDPDAHDTLTYSGAGAGQYGRLEVNSVTGDWTYTLDNESAATQALSHYSWRDEHFAVRASDGHGGFALQDLTIMVQGANDAPQINPGGDVTGLVQESAPDGTLVLTSGAAHGHYSVAADAGGRLLVLGATAFAEVPSDPGSVFVLPAAQVLYRLNPDGSRDTTFGQDGSIRVDLTYDKLAVDIGGGYVLGKGPALFDNMSSITDFTVTRFLADGAIDTAFGSSGTASVDFNGAFDSLKQVLALADGQLLLAGVTRINGESELALARLHGNGTLDTAFGGGGKLVLTVPGEHTGAYQAVAGADGAVTLWRESTVAGTGEKLVHLVRLLADGSMDLGFGDAGTTAFSLGTWYANRAAEVAVDAEGHVVIGWGKFDYESPVGYRPMLTRLNADGSLDTSFGDGGTADTQLGTRYGSAFGLTLDAQGHVLITSELPTPSGVEDFALARFNSDGSRDTSFGNDGVVTKDLGGADHSDTIIALPDGDVVLAGHSSQMYTSELAAFVRYNADGSLEETFGGPQDETVSGLLQASDFDAMSYLSWSGSANGIYGRFTISAGGAWTYTLDNARATTQALQEGQSATETFTAVVRDDMGATASEQVVITVVGTYDPPAA